MTWCSVSKIVDDNTMVYEMYIIAKGDQEEKMMEMCATLDKSSGREAGQTNETSADRRIKGNYASVNGLWMYHEIHGTCGLQAAGGPEGEILKLGGVKASRRRSFKYRRPYR
jgi:hypothetical protein